MQKKKKRKWEERWEKIYLLCDSITCHQRQFLNMLLAFIYNIPTLHTTHLSGSTIKQHPTHQSQPCSPFPLGTLSVLPISIEGWQGSRAEGTAMPGLQDTQLLGWQQLALAAEKGLLFGTRLPTSACANSPVQSG